MYCFLLTLPGYGRAALKAKFLKFYRDNSAHYKTMKARRHRRDMVGLKYGKMSL